MTAGFNIAPPAPERPALRVVEPSRPEMPTLSNIAIYDLARLFHEDRENALQLAAENCAANWGTSK